jgi:hypothetical protein
MKITFPHVKKDFIYSIFESPRIQQMIKEQEVNKIQKYCWFCQAKCDGFISICKICDKERFKKQKNI